MILPEIYSPGTVIRSRRDQVQYDREGRPHLIEKDALAIILDGNHETSTTSYLRVLSGGCIWSIDVTLVHAAWARVQSQ